MKFRTADDKYLTKRKALSQSWGERETWSVIDHWPLYCGIANLSRSIAILDLVRRSLDVPGHVAEFGSWRGANLMYMAKLLRILDPLGSKQLHSFDSFEGLQTFAPEDMSAVGERGRYRGNLEELMDMIDLYEMNDEIVIHKGFISDTLPPLLKTRQELSFSLVYCDLDLYEPTRDVLNQLHSRLSRGGMFVLDEWNYENYPGETQAVREFLETHGAEYTVEHVKGARQPSLVLVKA